MAFSSSIIRYARTLSIASTTPRELPLGKLLFCTCSSQAADKFLIHLHQNQFDNVENTLNTVKAKLDYPCINQVLNRCVLDKPQLALRFFIWAGLQSSYRHSPYMYSKACEVLEIEKNPGIIASVLDEYRAEGSMVSVRMFKVVLGLCRAAKDANLGLWVLRKMKEFNCRPDTVSYNVVIRLLVDKGSLDEARGLLREMGLIDLYPDMVTYVSVIKGFCDAGRLDDVCGLIEVMKGHGCAPNSVVYSMLLDGICKHGALEKAVDLLSMFEKENDASKPNVVTYTTMIDGFIDKGKMTEAVSLLNRMMDLGVRPNKVTIIALLEGLCKNGLAEEACKVTDKIAGNVFCNEELYSILIVSLLRCGEYKEAETKIRMMLSCEMRPNGFASGGMVKRMILEGRVLDGLGLFDALETSGSVIATDPDIYSILLAGLCKENHFQEAAKLVNRMMKRRILLKSSLAENIAEHLKVSREFDLASLVISNTSN